MRTDHGRSITFLFLSSTIVVENTHKQAKNVQYDRGPVHEVSIEKH